MKLMAEKMLCALLILGSFIYFWFSIFSLKTTFMLLLFNAALVSLFVIRLIEIHDNGLNNISDKLRRVLFERSLFDILCDIWYFQAIKRHVKFFLSPFIIRKSPEEIIESMEDINPNLKSVILQRGIINILPQKVQGFLLKNTKIIPKKDKADGWDRLGDYEQYQLQKQKQNPRKTLLYLSKLLFHKPIVQIQDYRDAMNMLAQKSSKLFMLSMFFILLKCYYSKSARRFYVQSIKTLSSGSLLFLAITSCTLMLASKKKRKQI